MKVEFGLPLQAPIQQTILPIVVMQNSTAEVVGYTPIAQTEFTNGAVHQLTVGGVTYFAGSVNLPRQSNRDQTGYPAPTQFIAILFTQAEARNRPWLGIPDFRSNDHAGFGSYWTAATAAKLHWTFGPLVGSLVRGMGRYTTVIEGTPEPDVAASAELNWTASLDASENAACNSFDFNWLEVFEAEVSANRLPRNAIPLRIEVVEQPNAAIIAEVVQIPVTMPEFGKVYNTIRITRLTSTLPLGDYDFTFRVYHTVDGVEAEKEVTLTLTIR